MLEESSVPASTPMSNHGRAGHVSHDAAPAAGFTKGTLRGCFHGQPQNVAYVTTEESWEYIIKPGLRTNRDQREKSPIKQQSTPAQGATGGAGLWTISQLLAEESGQAVRQNSARLRGGDEGWWVLRGVDRVDDAAPRESREPTALGR
jgi:hypothetical protein